MINTTTDIARDVMGASGLEEQDAATVAQLFRVWSHCLERNRRREDYYLGHVRVKDLGISMPASLARKIDPRVNWPAKAVHALADRSTLSGFMCATTEAEEAVRRLSVSNTLEALYRKALICELKHGCAFWTVTKRPEDATPVISVYPATAAAGIWDDANKRIGAALTIAEAAPPVDGGISPAPSLMYVHTSTHTIELQRSPSGRWAAQYTAHGVGRPLVEPMAHAPTLERPFGSSRISRSAMSITDDAIRQRARMEAAAEASAFPQTWILGTAERITKDGRGFDATIGAISEITKDIDGDKPTIWQSAQLQMAPHTEYFRLLAAQMSSVTNVPTSFFGVNSDAPTSAEAIGAGLEPLIIDAKNLNRVNGHALETVIYMALALEGGTTYADQLAKGMDIRARFEAPAQPSEVSASDSALKMVQAFPKLQYSDLPLERVGYTPEEIRRINADARKAQAGSAISALLARKSSEGDAG